MIANSHDHNTEIPIPAASTLTASSSTPKFFPLELHLKFKFETCLAIISLIVDVDLYLFDMFLMWGDLALDGEKICANLLGGLPVFPSPTSTTASNGPKKMD